MTIIRRLTVAFVVVPAVVAVVLAAPVAAQTVPPGDLVDHGAARLAPGPIGDSALRALRQQDEEPPPSGLGGSRSYWLPAILTGTGVWLAWEGGALNAFSCGREDEPYGPFLGITCSEEDDTKSGLVGGTGVSVLFAGVLGMFMVEPVNVSPSLNGIRLSW